MDKCVFCEIFNGNNKEKIIYENDNFFSVPDINQKTEGHSLVISKKHFKTILDLPSSLGSELLDCAKNTALKLMKEYNAEGFKFNNNNFEAANQVVPHVHFHILPMRKDEKSDIRT